MPPVSVGRYFHILYFFCLNRWCSIRNSTNNIKVSTFLPTKMVAGPGSVVGSFFALKNKKKI